MKTYIATIFITAGLLLSGCGNNGHNHDHHEEDGDGHDHEHGQVDEEVHVDEINFSRARAEAVGLTTDTIKPEAFSGVIRVSGQILASSGDEMTVVAPSSGIVSYLSRSVADGMPLKSGEGVLTVSARNIADGDPVLKAKINYETTQKEYERAKRLAGDKIISDKEFEQLSSRYELARTNYEALASNAGRNGIKINSPFAGYLKNRMVSEGEYVTVGQPLFTVSQNKRLQLRAEAPESYYNDLKNVVSANFTTSYGKGIYKLSDLNGRMISFGKSPGQQSFYVPVTFEFENTGDLLPDSYADVYLLTAAQKNVFAVPVTAVTEEQGLYFVYLQLDEEGYKKQEIKLGRSNGDKTEITAGLHAGDIVVTQGVYQVKLAAASSLIPEGHSHAH